MMNSSSGYQAFFSTEEFAALVRILPESLRSRVSRKGHYFGIRPAFKLPNRRLLWDAAEIRNLVASGVLK
jgi:hypothetical protein